MRNAAQIELVDAHCHIDLFPNPDRLVAQAEAARVHTIAVTNAPFVYAHTAGLARGKAYVHAALGLHPELVGTHGHEVSKIPALLADVQFVGEVGLDYTTTDATLRAAQRRIFGHVLESCAESGNKVLTVHSRRAASDVIAAIGPKFPCKIILHWFTGTMRELERAIGVGLYFSVNAAMVGSKSGSALVAAMPRDRVLTESDGPFVKTGGTQASPLSILTVVDALARQWRVSPETAAGLIRKTFGEVTGMRSKPPLDVSGDHTV
ncbi:TatD family hydrolase [Polyangium jinanense]|uniref:Qat anti-phage system TatD family nuclease QatD n=1 Tax=Polyangium jinanense TaxID=2829994 RepID=UPI0023423764|nr:Qat anti-phage system TatD family nuclease QatD [Polyangium jinanense]MDC3956271.1 TatD family hydrolase [Polyangium jinanense]